MSRYPDSKRCTAGRAYTLLEMLLALVIFAMVGLAVALMLGGVGNATKAQTDSRRAVSQRQVAAARVGALTRSAAQVLATGPAAIVLWKGDLSGDGKPNLSELRRVEFNATTDELWSYEAPDSLAEASDTSFDLTTNFLSATDAVVGTTNFPGSVVLQRVTSWSVSLDNVDVQSARVVRAELTMTSEAGPDNITLVTHLHATSD